MKCGVHWHEIASVWETCKKMNKKNYEEERSRRARNVEIYRLHKVEGMSYAALMEKFGLSSAGLWKILSTFERENPQEAALMKRQGKEMTPEDYKELQRELSRLKKELERERLRADFYEEMVAYGEEVYGIKLKKAGTK